MHIGRGRARVAGTVGHSINGSGACESGGADVVTRVNGRAGRLYRAVRGEHAASDGADVDIVGPINNAQCSRVGIHRG